MGDAQQTQRRSWRWPIWLALSSLLLGVPALVWLTRVWWPSWSAVLGRVDWICDLPPEILAREAEADAAHAEEQALRRQLADAQEEVLRRRALCRLPPPPPPP